MKSTFVGVVVFLFLAFLFSLGMAIKDDLNMRETRSAQSKYLVEQQEAGGAWREYYCTKVEYRTDGWIVVHEWNGSVTTLHGQIRVKNLR